MEGITTSIDMFDHSKRTVFMHDDLLGRISSDDGSDFTVEPVNKPQRVITGEKNAIEYLITCSRRPAIIAQPGNTAQIALF